VKKTRQIRTGVPFDSTETRLYASALGLKEPVFRPRQAEVSAQRLAFIFGAKNAAFVFTVTRDFVRNCQTPVLILPDDIPAHPYAVPMEAAMLAPKAEVSMFPWKEPKERIPLAIRHIHSFLRANQPA
jgi:hypothetical protein